MARPNYRTMPEQEHENANAELDQLDLMYDKSTIDQAAVFIEDALMVCM